jgi:NADH/NAD ratio-sensing transcriptional regulator Rex
MFPKKNHRLVLSEEDEAAREATKRAYVDEVVEAYAAHIANKLAQQGFDVFNKQFDKHYGFTVEALRSTLLMTMGLNHPFQEVVEHTVKTLGEMDADNDDDEFDPA